MCGLAHATQLGEDPLCHSELLVSLALRGEVRRAHRYPSAKCGNEGFLEFPAGLSLGSAPPLLYLRN